MSRRDPVVDTLGCASEALYEWEQLGVLSRLAVRMLAGRFARMAVAAGGNARHAGFYRASGTVPAPRRAEPDYSRASTWVKAPGR